MRVPAPRAVATPGAALLTALLLAAACGSPSRLQAAGQGGSALPANADSGAGLRSLDGGQGAAGAPAARGEITPAGPTSLATASRRELAPAAQPATSGRPGPPTLSAQAQAEAAAASSTTLAAGGGGSVSSTPTPEPTVAATPTSAGAPPPSAPVATGPGGTTGPTTATTAAASTTSTSLVLITDGTADPADLALGEVHSLSVLNLLRQSVAVPVPPLTRDTQMDAYAREWSRHMAETGDFNHSPGPYGENIAFSRNTQLTASEAADLFEKLWTDSPDHYANMTLARYTKVGIGLYRTSRGWYGTHVFSY